MQNKEIETWADILDFPDYQASCLGDIRNKRSRELVIPHLDNRGYLKLSIRCSSGLLVAKHVHYFIALAFLGVRPKGLEINHIDGVKTNNKLDNLEYITHAENCAHAAVLGLQKPRVGSKNGMSKLTESQVKEIRDIAANSGRYYGRKELATKYGVSECTIKEVVTRRKNKFYNVH